MPIADWIAELEAKKAPLQDWSEAADDAYKVVDQEESRTYFQAERQAADQAVRQIDVAIDALRALTPGTIPFQPAPPSVHADIAEQNRTIDIAVSVTTPPAPPTAKTVESTAKTVTK